MSYSWTCSLTTKLSVSTRRKLRDAAVGGNDIEYLRVFVTGGIICAIAQIFIDHTRMTPARIMVSYVLMGILLTTAGLYKPIVEWGGAGATVPLTGFGYALANGVRSAISEIGWIGIFTGGVTAVAGGVTAAVFFGYLAGLTGRSGDK